MQACYPQLTLSADPLSSLMTLDSIISLNAKAVALTNKNLLGAHAFWRSFKESKTHAVVGLSIEVDAGDFPLTLFIYARNDAGWRNLVKLSSAIELESKPVVPVSWFKAYTKECYVVFPFQPFHSLDTVRYILDTTPKHLLRGGVERNNNDVNEEENQYVQTMNDNKTPIITINEIAYPNKVDSFSYDVLLAIRNGEVLPDIFRSLPDYYAPTKQQLDKWYKDYPEWLANTEEMLLDCHVNLESAVSLMPKFPTDDATSLLKSLCLNGLAERGTTSQEHYKRLDKELSIIQEMGFDDYFLIVHDFMDYAKQQDILTGPGRGSSAGSLVAYSLYITDVDPLAYNLLFERFLNPSRVSLPDIDIDFEHTRRKEVIDYVMNKYGSEYVSQIVTSGTLSMKASARDVGRVFGFTQEEMSFVSKQLTGDSLRDSWAKRSKEFHRFVMKSEHNKTWLRTASRLEGLPRNLSTHAAGIVLSPTPLIDIIPLMKGTDGLNMSQWAMDSVEQVGLLKMDFLGLRNLTLLKSIRSLIGEDVRIDLTDQRTLDLFRKGFTLGVFQFESDGMRKALDLIQPDSFEDLVAVSSLYRPGPMAYIPEYAERKKGQSAVTYPHDVTIPILEETYGIMIYQEQIMQVASVVAGYSYGEADLLRRAVSKKNATTLRNVRGDFLKRSEKRGMSMDGARKVFDDIEKFANYGFPKGHAVAYTMISFELAYLKTHYPNEFFASFINHVKGDLAPVVEDMRRLDVSYKPPNIFTSELESTQYALGLNLIKGVSKTILELIASRGTYENFIDFAFHLTPKHFKAPIIEPLIKSGALDQFGNRKALLNSVDLVERFINLYESKEEAERVGFPRFENIEDFTAEEKLHQEFEVYGFYLNGHPIELFKERLSYAKDSISDIPSLNRGSFVTVFGLVTRLRKIRTKNKDLMAFITLEDETESISCTLFPKQYEVFKDIVAEGNALEISGHIEHRDNKQQIIIQKIEKRN